MEKDDNKWYVYMHVNKRNNKVYVGITCKNPKDRWRNGANYKHNVYFNNAIIKEGWDGFKHIVFCERLNASRARLIERGLICLWKSNQRKYGYNLSSGGEYSHSGCKHSQKTREHLKEINLGDNNPRRRPKQDKQVANAPKLKPVYCVEINKSFESVQSAADFFGLEASNISKCCKGMRYTAGKMHWRYIK